MPKTIPPTEVPTSLNAQPPVTAFLIAADSAVDAIEQAIGRAGSSPQTDAELYAQIGVIRSNSAIARALMDIAEVLRGRPTVDSLTPT